MQDILWLTEWVLAMSTWICHMATKRKEWSRRALCVGNQNKAVRAYGCMELTKSLWQSKVSIFIKNIRVTQWKWLNLTAEPRKSYYFKRRVRLPARPQKAAAVCQSRLLLLLLLASFN